MPKYQCPSCTNIVELSAPSKPRTRRPCPACGDTSISDSCQVGDDAVVGAPPRDTSSKRSRTGVVGRSGAAPALTTWPPSTLNTNVTYVSDLSTVAWTGPGPGTIRLPFQLLDISNPNPQGLVIAVPTLAADAVAQLHCAEVTACMLRNRKSTDCTEATGEAAAVLAVLRDWTGYSMRWGFHCHSGPGIDQIWVKETAGSLTDVLIVEAKGPGAEESENPRMPPNFSQMSENWIVHNLATMMSAAKSAPGDRLASQGQLAAAIVRGLGLKVGKTYPVWGGASKSYYGTLAFDRAKKTIALRRLTVQASWQPDGMLSYVATEKPVLTAFTPTDPRHYRAAATRYPGLFPDATAPEITYP